MRELIWGACALVLLGPAVARAVDSSRPDSHAPIGVMGDHVHHEGEWMLSYRYMWMEMRGNRDHTSDEGVADVLNTPSGPGTTFSIAPTEMDMQMHMFGVMYAPSDRVTLMTMIPLIRMTMQHTVQNGVEFRTVSQGIGDVGLTALIRWLHSENRAVHFSLGLGMPTGSITQKDTVPLGRVRLPYPMQLGSGSWEVLPGLTYTEQRGDWSWGGQGIATFRLNENRQDYQLGPEGMVTGWLARRVTDWVSGSVRVTGNAWSNIHGSDDALNPALVPTADPDRRAGRSVDLGLGANLLMRSGPLAGHRLAVEFQLPVYQWLDGPQLKTDWGFTVGWQKAF